jgi:plastocyanin
MRRALVAFAAAVLVGLGAPAAPAQGNSAVDIRDGAFEPNRLEVRAGDAVRWQNLGERPHSVTSEDGAFDSGVLELGDGFEVRFDTPGTYGYRSVGEGDEAMTGLVVVVPVDDDGSTGSDSDLEAGGGSEGVADAVAEAPAPPGTETAAASRPSSSDVVLGQAAAVTIQDDVFVPRRIEIEAGGTVAWEHAGQRPHTVTASDGSFDSGTLETGGSFSRTFPQPGTYSYYCEFHGTAGGAGMARSGDRRGRGERRGTAGRDR